MSPRPTRRAVLAQLGAAGATALLAPRARANALPSPQHVAGGSELRFAGQPVECWLTPVSERTLRVSLLPVPPDGEMKPIEDSLVLTPHKWPPTLSRLRSLHGPTHFRTHAAHIEVSPADTGIEIDFTTTNRKVSQTLRIQGDLSEVRFRLGDGPVFGLGEGGPQFDRRGREYPMKHGQDVPLLNVLGASMPIPWLMGREGWAFFFHAPFGTIDLDGQEGRFLPSDSAGPLPLDFFIVLADEPPQLLTEYAKLTGYPHLPPIWSLGYLQSHRTLASRDELVGEARTFREKKMPCDMMIYLGTGFCPSGWNTGHGSFTFNSHVFPDPGKVISELHRENFRVALHVVNRPKDLHGSVSDSGPAAEDQTAVARYWAEHAGVFRLGVDGWWPDEGDALPLQACLTRNRMYWEGPQVERPNVRPFALHRNGYAGIQRYGWLWSGDIDSTWETLRAQVSVGINTSLSGMPFWGTDTGGFVTTPELTGELYVRWFQFSSFCTLFRSHGRTWKLRLPWGWNTGDYGPRELERYGGKAGLPDPAELRNAEVEPLCRKYLDLRYRLLPYLYTVIREAHETGVPVMRALWLHYPDDPIATGRADEYLWGRDLLVAPVTEKGAQTRQLYLPHGEWYDFWTEEKVEGGREISRPVDLATMPLYARAGAIVPMGPVKQYTTEADDGALSLTIYPGADGEFEIYQDDGVSFDYERGKFMKLRLLWSDHTSQLTVGLAPGSIVLGPRERQIRVRLAGRTAEHELRFDGTTKILRL